MSDPFEELKNLGSEGPAVPPLPAAEVRRRGERLRHRRNALSAAGAALAVAVIASGGLYVSQGTTGTTPPPGPATQAPAPAGSWVTEIPEAMSVTDGMSEPGGDNGAREVTTKAQAPWMLDPCRDEGAADDPVRSDFLSVGQPLPAGFEGRQLGVYPDADAAKEAMDGFRDEIGECQVYVADDGITEARTLPFGGAVAGADESLVVVDHAYTSGMRTTLASHFVVVRVGNAVFLMLLDGEFGAAPDDSGTARVDQEQRALAAGVIDRLCVFAADPCAGDAEPVLSEDDRVTADRLPPVESEFVGPWEAVEPQPVPTLSCQADSLESLQADELVSREFRAGSTVEQEQDYPTAMVNTAVLAFDDAESAAAAYQTVLGWVKSCTSRVDDSRPLAFNGEKPVRPDVEGGEGMWRNVHLFAPEVCQECDAIWFDRQGAALVGDRVVLVSFARLGGPLEPEGLEDAMKETFRVVVDTGRS